MTQRGLRVSGQWVCPWRSDSRLALHWILWGYEGQPDSKSEVSLLIVPHSCKTHSWQKSTCHFISPCQWIKLDPLWFILVCRVVQDREWKCRRFFLAAQFYARRIHVLQKHGVCFLMAYFFVSIFIYLISFTLKNISSKIHQGWLHSEMGGGLQSWIAGARDLLDKMDNCQTRQKVWTQICRSQMQKFSSFTFSHACVGEPGQKRGCVSKDLCECDFPCLHELLCNSQLWSSKQLLKALSSSP